MKQVEVADETYDRLVFAAKVFGVPVAEVVDRLMNAGRATAEIEARRARHCARPGC